MRYLFILVSIFFIACSQPNIKNASNNDNNRTHSLSGKLWHTKSKLFVPVENLPELITNVDYLLIGERHDNPDHHQLENTLIKQFQKTHPNTVVAFEMISQKQYQLVDFSSLQPGMPLSILEEKLHWSKNRGWPWKDYGMLIQTAINGDSTIIAANIDRATLMQLVTTEASTEFTHAFNTSRHFPNELKQHLLDEVFEGHCQLIPRQGLGAMVSIQLVRDAYMASNLYEYKGDNSVILIAGNTHIRKDYGAGWHLLQRAPSAKVVSIALFEIDPELLSPEQYLKKTQSNSTTYDYIWFTEKHSKDNDCEKLEAMMKKKKTPTN